MSKLSIILQKPVKTPDCSLYQFLLRRPKLNSSPVLCRCFSKELKFEDLKRDSLRYAAGFASIGVSKGDIVPIITEPSVEAVLVFFALNRLGAVSTFLNNTASDSELNEYITSFSASVVVISSSLEDRCKRGDIQANSIVVMDSEGGIIQDNSHILHMQALLDKSPQVEVDTAGKKDYAHISYTSGSTGAPKAIMLTNENIMAAITSLKKATMLRFGPKLNSLQVVPFNYPYGFIVSTLLHMYCGTTAVFSPGLTLKNISDYLEMYRPCYINGIPSFYTAMMQDPIVQKMNLSFIRYPITGGDTLDPKTEQRINDFLRLHGSKGVISNGYGNGEGGGCILNPTAVFRGYISESCGLPIPGLSVKLIDDKTGLPVPVGDIGRFCFSGTNLMNGYYQNGKVESDMFVTDERGMRWFYTDTYMHMDSKHWMFMDGRERRFFITFDEHGSPYKVYCEHVQKVILETCTRLQSCAVVQKPDASRSYIPVCYLCFIDEVDLSDYDALTSDIKAKCQKLLPNCAVPVEYHILKELPLSRAGKVDYLALENMAQEDM